MRNSKRRSIAITGIVQGVGFRPFVYRTAVDHGIAGFVRNTPAGVAIEAEGTDASLDAFVAALQRESPPLAEINAFTCTDIPPRFESSFVIETSDGAGTVAPAIAPDIATCDDCLRDMAEATDRRNAYAFTNCTNCGPRYTIVEGFPYDRAKTSMKRFTMCAACRSEYGDPRDRRFHAQPNACPACGPQLALVEPTAAAACGDPLARARSLLSAGNVVAVKGLGGFHLACDATNARTVLELRARKHRDMKPFAIMVGDLAAARALCRIDEREALLLTSPRRPVVLLAKRDGITVAEAVAPGSRLLGVMLPYTPLHHLLFAGTTGLILVMTSANICDEPIACDNDEAMTRLAGIADAFLMHNRPIHTRIDDSVLRPAAGRTIMMRRARGYVPQAIELPYVAPRILAVGGDVKNAFCIAADRRAYLSPHIGDLATAAAHDHFERTVDHLCGLFDIEPDVIACDMHPGYFSSAYAIEKARGCAENVRCKAPRLRLIQHHHAHVASCMAEHRLPHTPVIGIALDGAGYGPDGTIWGGEILRADYADFERLAHIRPVPQPGGDAAAREPWRMAVAYVRELSAIRYPLSAKTLLRDIPEGELALVEQALEKEINCPLTSSAGRLFDAAAAICGLATHNAYEGHAAMMLEQAAAPGTDGAYPVAIGVDTCGLLELDFRAALFELAADIGRGMDTAVASAMFHNTIIRAFADAVGRIGGNEPVVLSGGCMQNAYLLAGLAKALEDQGRKVYTHALVPPNDGGLALGQAAIAAHREG